MRKVGSLDRLALRIWLRSNYKLRSSVVAIAKCLKKALTKPRFAIIKRSDREDSFANRCLRILLTVLGPEENRGPLAKEDDLMGTSSGPCKTASKPSESVRQRLNRWNNCHFISVESTPCGGTNKPHAWFLT